jgi:hypothetical protein
MTSATTAQERFTADLFSGRTFHFAEQSNRSADRMSYRPMLPHADYGQVIITLGKAASMSRLFTYAVARALPKVSPFFTAPQVLAGIAQAFGDVVREGWTDVAAATGPEAGRASDHNHKLTEREIIFLNLVYKEVEYAFNGLGHLPGPGWVLAELVQERGINVPVHFLPNVAKALAK